MKKYSAEAIVGIFVVIGLVCVGYMTIKLGKVSLFGDDYYTVYARFSSVSGLKKDSPVQVHGIEVGRVEKMTLDTEKQTAVLALKVQKGLTIYDDAIASIKTSGLIGDKFVNIDPGGGGEALKAGAYITETNSPTDMEELISKYAFGDVSKKKNDAK
ncbi:MAG: outer membrane lipid asymmetry maintenance protein MlaD [Nitrospirae bacterium]|nr:outer membrane lipid asymmetry maintenance protein MlaD [Nitrospirota bacterium]